MTHRPGYHVTDHGYAAACACGWSYVGTSTDAVSRRAIAHVLAEFDRAHR